MSTVESSEFAENVPIGDPLSHQPSTEAPALRSESPNRNLFPLDWRIPRALTLHASPFQGYQFHLDSSVAGMPYLTEELLPLFNSTDLCPHLQQWDRLPSNQPATVPAHNEEFGPQKAVVMELGLASRSLVTMTRVLGLYLFPRERIDLWDWRVFEVLARLEGKHQSGWTTGSIDDGDQRIIRIAKMAKMLEPHYFGFVAAVPEPYHGRPFEWTSMVDPDVARSGGTITRSSWHVNGNRYFCPRGYFEGVAGLMPWRHMCWEVARDWVDSDQRFRGESEEV
ncbi:MAG: hypothetical protein M1831_002358 [Alyxoria varia]|nr:MAG: hypothetical protein M1831_002358 [Alyxoria varia]